MPKVIDIHEKRLGVFEIDCSQISMTIRRLDFDSLIEEVRKVIIEKIVQEYLSTHREEIKKVFSQLKSEDLLAQVLLNLDKKMLKR